MRSHELASSIQYHSEDLAVVLIDEGNKVVGHQFAGRPYHVDCSHSDSHRDRTGGHSDAHEDVANKHYNLHEDDYADVEAAEQSQDHEHMDRAHLTALQPIPTTTDDHRARRPS